MKKTISFTHPMKMLLLLLILCQFQILHAQVENKSSNESSILDAVSSGYSFCCPGIKTETIAIGAWTRNRKTIAVGEEVILSLPPGESATWEINGPGMLNMTSGNSIMFTAPVEGGMTTITANISLTCTPSVKFTIVEPKSIESSCNETKLCFHRGDYPSGAMAINMNVVPKDVTFPGQVSFYNIEFQEQAVPTSQIIKSEYWGIIGAHMQGPWAGGIDDVDIVKGTFITVDFAGFYGPLSSPDGIGSARIPIPMHYRIKGSGTVNIIDDVLPNVIQAIESFQDDEGDYIDNLVKGTDLDNAVQAIYSREDHLYNSMFPVPNVIEAYTNCPEVPDLDFYFCE